MEDEKIIYQKADREKLSPKTYMTKERFVELLQFLDYKYIETAEIEFITGFLLDVEKDTISPIHKGYKIDIR